MREIKFRAWDKKKKKMYFAENEAKDGACYCFYFYEDGSWELVGAEDKVKLYGEKGILMQFTGLLDKRGKEIYEGDILKRKNGDIGEVIWEGERYWMRVVKHGISSLFPIRYSKDLEVIGNIYEDEKLLK